MHGLHPYMCIQFLRLRVGGLYVATHATIRLHHCCSETPSFTPLGLRTQKKNDGKKTPDELQHQPHDATRATGASGRGVRTATQKGSCEAKKREAWRKLGLLSQAFARRMIRSRSSLLGLYAWPPKGPTTRPSTTVIPSNLSPETGLQLLKA